MQHKKPDQKEMPAARENPRHAIGGRGINDLDLQRIPGGLLGEGIAGSSTYKYFNPQDPTTAGYKFSIKFGGDADELINRPKPAEKRATGGEEAKTEEPEITNDDNGNGNSRRGGGFRRFVGNHLGKLIIALIASIFFAKEWYASRLATEAKHCRGAQEELEGKKIVDKVSWISEIALVDIAINGECSGPRIEAIKNLNYEWSLRKVVRYTKCKDVRDKAVEKLTSKLSQTNSLETIIIITTLTRSSEDRQVALSRLEQLKEESLKRNEYNDTLREIAMYVSIYAPDKRDRLEALGELEDLVEKLKKVAEDSEYGDTREAAREKLENLGEEIPPRDPDRDISRFSQCKGSPTVGAKAKSLLEEFGDKVNRFFR